MGKDLPALESVPVLVLGSNFQSMEEYLAVR